MRLSFQRLFTIVAAAASLLPLSTALAEDNTVTLCDRGVRNIPGRLVVGSTGNNNALIVTGGAVVNSGASETGLRGTHNRVLVSGPDSCWSNQFSFKVGVSGGWNQVVVADGGRLMNSHLAVIGDNTRTPGNQVVITDRGSTWHNSRGLTVGWGGRFSSLVVSNGAQVFNLHTVIGRDTSAISNSVTVSGEDSLWRNDGILILGVHGASNRLMVADRGTIAATSLRSFSPGNVIEIDDGYLFLTNRPKPAAYETTLAGVPWQEIDFTNSFRLEHSTTLAFELHSSHAGNTLPFVAISGIATLDGDLVIRLAEGFESLPGAVFTLMRFAAQNGNFRNVSSGERITTVDQSGSFRVLITESVVQLTDFRPASSFVSRRPKRPPTEQSASIKSGSEVKRPTAAGVEGAVKTPFDSVTDPPLPTLPTLRCVVRDGVLGLELPWNPQRKHRLWVSTNLQTWIEVTEPVFEFPSPDIGRWKVQPAPNATGPVGVQIFRLSVE